MTYKTHVIDFDDAKERTGKLDAWMQAPGNEDVRIKNAVLGSDQALIIYDDETPDDSTVKSTTR